MIVSDRRPAPAPHGPSLSAPPPLRNAIEPLVGTTNSAAAAPARTALCVVCRNSGMVKRRWRHSLLAGTALATASASWLAPAPAVAAADSGLKACGGPGSQSIEGITAVDGGFVAVGNETIAGDTAPVAWRGSANGHVWKRSTRPQLPAPVDVRLETSIAAVMSCERRRRRGRAKRSTTRETTRRAAIRPRPCSGARPDPVRSCSARRIRRVTPRRCPPTGSSDSSGRRASRSGDNRFVAGGEVAPPSGNPACSHPLTWASTDNGSTWSVSALPFPSGGAGRVEAVTYDSASGFVAVGRDVCGGVHQQEHGCDLAIVRRRDVGPTASCRRAPTRSASTASADLVVVMGVGTKAQRGGCDAVFWTSADLDEWTTYRRQHQRARGRCRRARGRFVRRLRRGMPTTTARPIRSCTARSQAVTGTR